jgi:hypothetical protein
MSDRPTLRGLVIGAALLAIVISVPSSLALVAPYGYDLDRLLTDPGSIVVGGRSSATLFHWGALGDLLYSYVLWAPLALYLHGRLRPRKPWLADLGLVGAFAYIVVGGAGAAILAAAGPPLIEAYETAAASDRLVIATAFDTLARAVMHGLWQTLDPISLGTWLLSVGWLIRVERPKLGRLLVVLGVGGFLASVRTMFGFYGLGFLVVGFAVLLVVWVGWLVLDRSSPKSR